MGNFKATLLLLLENALKLNLNPLQGPTHTVTPSHRTLCMDLSWYALNSVLYVKTLYHTEKQRDLAILAFKKFQTHPPKPVEVEPSFRKVSLPAKLHMLIFGFESLATNLLPLIGPGFCLLSKILASTKMGGA